MIEWTRRSALGAGATLGLGLGLSPRRALARAASFDPKAIDALRAPARNAVAAGDVPGAIALVWRRGELAMIETAGLVDIAQGRAMSRDAIFGIASMSKPVTVALALTLVDQGVMRLDDPITRWAPEFADMRVLRRADGPLDDTIPAPRAITVEDLMSHRSGLAYGVQSPGPLGGALMQRFGLGLESDLAPDAWMKALAELPLAYAPGERFNYGHSIDVLGFIAARAAGTDLRALLHRNLCEPLGMKDTDFWIPPEKRARAAAVYTSPAPGRFIPITIQSWIGAGPRPYQSGGQGLVSTADDYLAFARMLVRRGEGPGGRQILRPATARLMTSNLLSPGQRRIPAAAAPDWRSHGFGLGVQVITDPQLNRIGYGRAGAFGWGGAFGGWWQGDPAEDMVLIWLQHALPAPPSAGDLTLDAQRMAGPPRIPGAAGTLAFQRAVYGALDG